MMSSESDNPTPRVQIFRRREGRILGGVCAGLPKIWGLGTNGLRVLFVLAALLGGIGIVLYCACWLVMPAGDTDFDSQASRPIVIFAWALAGLIALILIVTVSTVATIFGLGWLVLALAAVLLAIAMLVGARNSLPAPAVMVTLAALTLPATAVALSPIRLSMQSGAKIVRPATATQVAHTTYTSGFGTMLIDLRRTQLPASGDLTMHIDAGLRRTIVALPNDACVRVRVNYHLHRLASNLATLFKQGNFGQGMISEFYGVVLFGRAHGTAIDDSHGSVDSPGTGQGPTLTIDFSSQGGSLFVRDYPYTVAPDNQPTWPGFWVTPEPRPNFNKAPLKGESAKLKREQLNSWQRRHKLEVANARVINKLMGGPCSR